VDNGRSQILRSPETRETLLCIRCGACLNICPVYNSVGGYTYGYPISGPTGVLFATQILGTGAARGLPFASTLCGACNDICPVKIPSRRSSSTCDTAWSRGTRRASGGALPSGPGRQGGAASLRTTWLYRLGAWALRWLQLPFVRDGWMAHLPPPLHRWTMARPLPAFAADFRRWWCRRSPKSPQPPFAKGGQGGISG